MQFSAQICRKRRDFNQPLLIH